MAMDSDDEQELPTIHPSSSSVSRPTRFTFDDAFSDTEDADASYEFSAEAIRADLEKNLSGGDAGHHSGWPVDQDLNDIISKIGYSNSHEPDSSVSTFHIDAGYGEERSLPTHQSSSLDLHSVSHASEESLDEDFTSVNLQSPPEPEVEEPPFRLRVEEEEDEPQYAQSMALQQDLSRKYAQNNIIQAETQPSHSPPTPVRSISPPTPHRDEHGSSATSTSAHPVTPRSNHSVSSLAIATSPSLPTPSSATSNASTSTATGSKHRITRSAGPSMLDKVISKTRPTFLPPKPKAEDLKHLADWEQMMKKSRAAEEKRRKELQQRRFARERRIDDSLALWEKDVVPNWKVVHKDPRLRKLWWQGIPTKLRATMWQNAVGNSLALSKDAYKACAARANRALSSGTFPSAILNLIEEDISTTLPSLHLFAPETGPMYQDLKEILCAWVVSRSDEGLGYVPGVAKIMAMVLINMAPAQGFIVVRNLLERHCLRSFYGGTSSKDDVEAYYRIFDTLLADGMPKIYFNFKQHQISPAAYLPDWLMSMFLDHLPFEACARLWDIIFLEGDAFLFRASLAILALLESRLFFPDKQELLEVLRAENKAALQAAKRNGLTNNAKYEIYDIDEEKLWERLDAMEDWWRETTWTRLIQRELPDL
ncbi:RabGAP/TBC [Trametopsis cervina]|nr:RabGAP/TBC [Trametopsis cervina]